MSCFQGTITDTKTVRGRRIHADSFNVKLSCSRDQIHDIFRTPALKHNWFQNKEVQQYLADVPTEAVTRFEMDVEETIWYSDEYADLTIQSCVGLSETGEVVFTMDMKNKRHYFLEYHEVYVMDEEEEEIDDQNIPL